MNEPAQTVTIQVLAWDDLPGARGRPGYGSHNMRGVYRPVTYREWSAIERKYARPRPARKGAPRPVGSRPGMTRFAPLPKLANGQTVAAALASRNAGRPTLAEVLTDAGYPYAVAYGGAPWPPVADDGTVAA